MQAPASRASPSYARGAYHGRAGTDGYASTGGATFFPGTTDGRTLLTEPTLCPTSFIGSGGPRTGGIARRKLSIVNRTGLCVVHILHLLM